VTFSTYTPGSLTALSRRLEHRGLVRPRTRSAALRTGTDGEGHALNRETSRTIEAAVQRVPTRPPGTSSMSRGLTWARSDVRLTAAVDLESLV
jgi:hypothetical protein